MGQFLIVHSPGSTQKNRKNLKMKTSFAVLFIAGLAMASAAAPSKSMPLSYKQTMRAKSIQCDICKMLVTELDNIIISATTSDELIQMVEKLCGSLDSIFPGFGATCDSFVETYLPQIIEGIVNNQLSPASVCQALTLCSARRF